MFVPTIVYGGFKFATIASGVNHACALTPSHDALCWGNESGPANSATAPGRTGWLQRSSGGGLSFQSIAAVTRGRAGCPPRARRIAGERFRASGPSVTPHGYDSAPVFVSLAVGSFHACALTGDGIAYCWGDNQFGQLGDSTTVSRTDPTPVVGGMKFKSIAPESRTPAASPPTARWRAGVLNLAGELGDKTTVTRSVPRFVVLGVTP